jgi:hypothetical protein
MISRTTSRALSHVQPRVWLLVAGGAIVAMLLWTIAAHAANSQVPWECSNYSEEAQTRCLNAFIEQQREQISKLEGQLQAQQETVKQLKGQADRQAAASADLQQQLSQRPTATTVVPSLYAYNYVYPPVGFGLYLGRPRIYGPPYFYHSHWGPRFYGRWGRRW